MANKSIRKKKFILIKSKTITENEPSNSLLLSRCYNHYAITDYKYYHLKNIYIVLRQRRVFYVKNFLLRYIVGTTSWLRLPIP